MSKSVVPPCIVFDCMIFVQAAANEKSSAARLFDLLDEGKIVLLVSKATIAEVHYVLTRPDVRSALRTLTDVTVEALFERIEQKSTLIRKVPSIFLILVIRKTNHTSIWR